MIFTQPILLLTKEPYFLKYFQQHCQDKAVAYDNFADLACRVFDDVIEKKTSLFAFLDETVLSKPDFESALQRLHSLDPSLFYIISYTDLSEALWSRLQKVTDNQVVLVDETASDVLLKQAVSQIAQLAELQTSIDAKAVQIEIARQKLNVQDKLFNNLLSVIKFDSEGKIISINPHGTQEMGWRNDRVEGASIHDIVLWSNDGSGIVQYFATFSGETRYFDGDGRQKWAFAQVQKVKEEKAYYFYFVGKDITEQKQFARRLQYENYQEGVLKAKSDLIHDIGNTLNSMSATYGVLASGVEQLEGISSYIKRWCEEKQSLSLPVETSYHFIEAIENSCHFILDKHFAKTTLALKNNLALLIDAVGSEQQSLPIEQTQEVVNLYNLIQDVVLSSQALLNEKKITIQVLDSNTSIFLKLSYNQLFQALLNLIKNAVEAIEFSNKPSRFITVQTCQNKGDIQLVVQDSGSGIGAADLKKIFHYGFTTKEGGSGQGLHSVANFMNKNGGKLEVVSCEENGTRFILTFPVNLLETLPET